MEMPVDFYSADEIRDIVDFYKSHTGLETAKKYGISRTTLQRYVKRMNYRKEIQRESHSPEKKQEVIEAYRQGMGTELICKKYGICRRTLYKYLEGSSLSRNRPATLSKIAEVRQLFKEGLTYSEISQISGLTLNQVKNYKKRKDV